MEQGAEVFDTWMKTQKEYMEQWMEGVAKLQETFWSYGTSGETKAEAPAGGLFDLYRSWFDSTAGPFAGAAGQYTPDVIKDTYSRFFESSSVYMKLYEVWLSIAGEIQKRAMDTSVYGDLLDLSNYKKMSDLFSGSSLLEPFKEAIDQSARFMGTWGPMANNFVKPWAEAMGGNVELFPKLAAGDTEPFMRIVHNLFNAFFDTFGKVFKIPAVGKNREEIELFLRNIDRFSVYMARNTEFQHLIYTTGLKATERVIETINSRIKEGKAIKGFDDFSSLWLEVNEKAFLELFGTEEFSRMQAQLLDAALDVRKHMNDLMELYLEDFPVALRSEMDDVAKTVYDWKRKVYDLEKKVKSLENGSYAQMRSELDDVRKRLDTLYAKADAPGTRAEPKRSRRVQR